MSFLGLSIFESDIVLSFSVLNSNKHVVKLNVFLLCIGWTYRNIVQLGRLAVNFLCQNC